jgi:hypothetical protein
MMCSKTLGLYGSATRRWCVPKKLPSTSTPARQPERQEMLAMLLATGRFTMAQISELSGYQPSTIRTMRRSPVFRELIKRYQKTIYHSIVDQALADLLQDAPENVEWLKNVRDGQVVDDPSALAVRARAATTLLDRQIPKRQQEEREGGVKIVINADLKERFDSADEELEKYGAIPVEAEEVE